MVLGIILVTVAVIFLFVGGTGPVVVALIIGVVGVFLIVNRAKARGKLSGIEGIRSAMRQSYKQHFQKQLHSPSTDNSAHSAGLFGALATRNLVSGRDFSEPDVWMELTPFLYMEQMESVRALQEYAVYREAAGQMRLDDIAFLRSQLNQAVNRIIEEAGIDRLSFALLKTYPWVTLFDERTRSRIQTLLLDTGTCKIVREFLAMDGLDIRKEVRSQPTSSNSYFFFKKNILLHTIEQEGSVEFVLFVLLDSERVKFDNGFIDSGKLHSFAKGTITEDGQLQLDSRMYSEENPSIDFAFLSPEDLEGQGAIDFIVELDKKRMIHGKYDVCAKPDELVQRIIQAMGQ